MSATRGPTATPFILSIVLTLALLIIGGVAMAIGSSQGVLGIKRSASRASLLLGEGKLDLNAISAEALAPKDIEGVTLVPNKDAHRLNLAGWISAPAAAGAERDLTTVGTACFLAAALSLGITVLLWVQRPRTAAPERPATRP